MLCSLSTSLQSKLNKPAALEGQPETFRKIRRLVKIERIRAETFAKKGQRREKRESFCYESAIQWTMPRKKYIFSVSELTKET